jgi:hypothetical protein
MATRRVHRARPCIIGAWPRSRLRAAARASSSPPAPRAPAVHADHRAGGRPAAHRDQPGRRHLRRRGDRRHLGALRAQLPRAVLRLEPRPAERSPVNRPGLRRGHTPVPRDYDPRRPRWRQRRPGVGPDRRERRRAGRAYRARPDRRGLPVDRLRAEKEPDRRGGLAHRMRTAGDVGLAPTELRELPCSSLCSAGARSAVSSARRSRAAVTLVEMADRLLLKEPEGGALIARRLAAEGVDVRLRPRRSRSVARRSSSSSRPTARPTRSRSTAC